MAIVTTTQLGNGLQELLMCDEIIPGAQPSYQIAKTILSLHPLGLKMTESPVTMALSQSRDISIPDGPEDRIKEQFIRQWEADSVEKHIINTAKLARTYGISSIALLTDDLDPSVAMGSEQFPLDTLWKRNVSWNVFDPLNTAGSLVLNQNPNAPDFQKTQSISVSGKRYHRSRVVIILNEDPIYIDYTVSAFGFVGRSVFQRALFPLKSFINTLVTDDMVVRKVGVLVAKQKSPGSIIDDVMRRIAGIKRAILREAQTDNVISIGTEEEIESLNLQNLEAPYSLARRNIIENIATAADMPAKILLQETFAEGFGEGTEDAKYVARYIDRVRVWLQPLYTYFDPIIQRRAWNPEFYETIKKDFPEYRNVPYNTAFYRWQNSFTAAWPSLLTEPPSEKIKVDDVKLRAALYLLEVLMPIVRGDTESTLILIRWLCDQFNELKLLFQSPLELNYDTLEDSLEEAAERLRQSAEQGEEGKKPNMPGSFASDSLRGSTEFREAVASLAAITDQRRDLRDRRRAALRIGDQRRG